MKNYRLLVAVALVALMVLSGYKMVSDASSDAAKVDKLLITAQQQAAEGLYGQAAHSYSEAISIEDRIEYYVDAIRMYFDAGEMQACISWCEKTMESFPLEKPGYEWLTSVYIKDKSYGKAYEVIDEFEGRKLESKIMSDFKDSIKSTYYLDYCNCTELKSFSSDYFALYHHDLWGLGNVQGKQAVVPQYSYVGYVCSDVVPVKDLDENWFFMDTVGELTHSLSSKISGRIEEVGLVNNELFPAKVNGKYNYYNMELLPVYTDYDYAGSFSRGVAAIRKGNTWRLLDIDGKYASEQSFDDIVTDERGVCCIQGVISAKVDGQYYFYDEKGKKIGTNGFAETKAPGPDGLIAIRVDGLWGFANAEGEILIEPQFLDAKSFSCGYAAVSDGTRWGFIDENGELKIDYIFDDCRSFSSQGTAFGMRSGEWQVIKLYRFNH